MDQSVKGKQNYQDQSAWVVHQNLLYKLLFGQDFQHIEVVE